MMKAKIFEIKRFAVHDGDGIRTTVFFKGCPLKCAWCHNPEGIRSMPQLAHYQNKCISCGECVSVCPANAHSVHNGEYSFDREKCVNCGRCADVCIGNALVFYGKELSVDEILEAVLEDREFYENSGGGVTLSGGECLVQSEFCAELLKKLKASNIHTAVDTCGFVSQNNLDMVMPYTDVFLYDLKAYDEDVHKKCTGQSNEVILRNLKYIDDCAKKIEIRIPFVPGYNSGEVVKLAEVLKTIKNLTKVKILPYHSYAGTKYLSLDMENTMPEALPTDEEIKEAENIIKKACSK